MPFIGQQPITGAYSKLDSITTSATATYNLQLNGGAYYPQSANHLLVSLNGVMQAPQDSFTVSGSQITFASALTSSDSIDFIMALGDVLDIGTPSDGSVNTSQLANDAVTNAKIGAAAVNTTELGTGINLTGKIATGHETLSDHIATAPFAATGYTSANNFVTIGSLPIPKPGIWRVSTQMRIRWGNVAYFTKMYLTSSGQAGNSSTIVNEIYAAGGSANSAARMLYERITVTSFGNLVIEPAWIVDIPTGLTSGATIYFSVQPNGADGYAMNNNDQNGRPGAHAIKVAETTTSGSTITTRGF